MNSLSCSTCGQTKPASEFFRRSAKSRGYEYACKVCSTKRHTSYPLYKKKNDRWRKANKIKVQAHGIVSRALKQGELEKPTACENCIAKSKLNAHHPDYSRPLHVQWLCTACHYNEHHKEVLA